MPETNGQQQEERRAYLLDISLFIFDVLNPQKILRSVSDGNAILEVPSAFVTMIWSSVSGDTLLQDLIYAYLIGLKNNGTLERNSNQQIRRWANATDEQLRDFSQIVLDHVLNFYSQYIDGATRGNSQIRSFYPIRRYEPVLPDQSNEDLLKMRDAYITELGIRSHPLYDLYFLQIYHSQSIGVAASPLLPRVFIFLGRQAASAITRWVGETDPRAIGLSTRERYLRTLGWFINEHIADELLDDAVNGILGVGISFIAANVPGIGILTGVSVASYIARKVVINPIVKSPYLLKETDVPALLGIFGTLFVVCICGFAFLPGLRENLFGNSVFATPTTQPPTILDIQTSLPSPAIQSVNVVPAEVIVPTSTLIPVVDSSLDSNSGSSELNYCLYVVQPGDTFQSVMLRYHVSESGIKTSDDLSLVTFQVNQTIKVDTSCCSVINGQGFSYTVQRGDNLYRIAKQNSVSFEHLVSVNNLYDPRYIQAGQMLCIPSP